MNTGSAPVPARRAPRLTLACALVVVVAGIVARARQLDEPRLWVDEAESSINALGILEHGVPTDRHLGMPIFENTLTQPWPESEEYEFRDSSYSRRGLAIYHGWLPLYSIAASFLVFGIEPEPVTDPPRACHAVTDIERRTWVPRVPSLVFSALFLAGVFQLGSAVLGPGLGLALLVVAAGAQRMIWFGRQARYYSATLALQVLVALAIWNVARRGRWRDFIVAGVLAALLFHTHMLSLVALAAAGMLLLPRVLGHERAFAKLVVLAAIVMAATLPWIALTGFLDEATAAPTSWSFLEQPSDLFLMRIATPVELGLMALAALAFALSALPALRRRLPARFAALAEAGGPLLFAGAWTIFSYLAFVLLIPAASFFSRRLTLMVAVPAMLVGGIAVIALVQAFVPRATTIAGLVLAAVYLMASGQTGPASEVSQRFHEAEAAWTEDLVDLFAHTSFRPGTRIYGTPNEHLDATWYTGLPIQSVAPVRRSFLDEYPGDLFVIELQRRYSSLPVDTIQEIAVATGTPLTAGQAGRYQTELGAMHVRADLEGRVAAAFPPLAPLTPLDAALFARQTEVTRGRVRTSLAELPMHRGIPSNDWLDWWQIFTYRFLDLELRRGDRLNYAARTRLGKAFVRPSQLVIYDCCPGDGESVLPSERFTLPLGPMAAR